MNIKLLYNTVSKFSNLDTIKKYHYIDEYVVIVYSHGVTSVLKNPSSSAELVLRTMKHSTLNRLSKGTVSIYCSENDIDVHDCSGCYTIDYCIDDINDDILFQYSTVNPYTHLISEYKHVLQFIYHNNIEINLDHDFDTIVVKLREYYERIVTKGERSIFSI